MDIIQDYFNQHIETLYYTAEHNKETIQLIADQIIDCFNSGCKLLICGNGGSAADAQHIATEMVCRFRRNRIALPAIALTCDTSLLTAVPNDFGYDSVFSRQVEALGNSGDILIAISTSGMSQSIINAAQQAKEVGVQVIAFTGMPGSPLEQFSDISFTTHCDVTSITQEIHEIAYHLVCELVELAFAD